MMAGKKIFVTPEWKVVCLESDIVTVSRYDMYTDQESLAPGMREE